MLLRGILPSCRMTLKGPEIGTNVKLHGHPRSTGGRCCHQALIFPQESTFEDCFPPAKGFEKKKYPSHGPSSLNQMALNLHMVGLLKENRKCVSKINEGDTYFRSALT